MVACGVLYGVAPFTGAWIEIVDEVTHHYTPDDVAPFTGAWIEIRLRAKPLRVRLVAPFTGAWIEICL